MPSTDLGYAWVVCGAACMVHFVVSGIQNSYGVLYIYILKELGAGDKTTSAWVGSINLGVDFLLSPFVTWACDRWGCRVTGVIGGLVGTVGLVASSFIRDIYLLYLTYGIVLGTGCGLCYITTFKALSCWFYRRIAFANSLCLAWECLGSVVMAPVLQRMLSTFGLSWTFLVLSGMFIINSVMAFVYRTPPAIKEKGDIVKNTDHTSKEDSSSVLKDGPFVTFMVSSFVLHLGYTVTFVHVPTYAKETGISETKAALLMSILFPCRLLSALCFGKVVDHFHRHRLVFFQLGTLGVGLVQTFLTTATNFPSLVALMVCHGICGGIVIPLRPVIVEDILGKQRASKGLGIYFGALAVPYVAGSPLAGWIYDISKSYQLSFLVAGGFCVASCCILFIVPLFQDRSRDGKTLQESNEKKSLLLDQGLEKYADILRSFSSESSACHKPYGVIEWTKLYHGARETDV